MRGKDGCGSTRQATVRSGCGAVVNVPHQSMPKVNALRPEPLAVETIQARIPRALEDALDLVTAAIGGQARDVCPAIVRYYLTRVAEDPAVAAAVRLAAATPIAMVPADRRFAVKFPLHYWRAAWAAAQAAGFTSKSELLRGVMILAAEDCHIHLPQRDTAVPKSDRAARERCNFLKALAKSI